MRVALLSSAIVLVAMTAAPASAQQAASGNAAGLRYLSWPGKPAVTATAVPAATTDLRPALPAEYAPQSSSESSVAASSSVYGYTPAPQRMASNGLTPASNWLRPATEPAAYSAPTPYAPVPTAPAPTPNPAFVPQPQPQPMRAPVQQPPMVEQPLVQAPPIQSGPIPTVATPTARLVQAQPPLQLPEPQSQAQLQQQAAADPMAPRRDAPIFRIQGQPQARPTAAASAEPQAQTYQTAQAAPASGSARYYSVHRPLGRTPDPAPQPQPVYLDALPVELISPPQSADLAEPQSGPALIRNSNGTVRAMPAASEGDHQ